MGFWSSFWRETGKNTGKWASNKIFGRGWSTPYSHDVNVTNTSSPASNDGQRVDNNLRSESIIQNDSQEVERSNRMLDEDFSKDPMVLFNQVSDFIAQLNTRTVGVQSSGKKSALITKARHGIMLMEMGGMHEAAAEFRSQLRQYRIKQIGRFILAIVFLGILLLGLLLVANN
jgi:hypothetical protein